MQKYDWEMVPPTQTAIGCLAVATDMAGAITWPGGAAQKTHELILACQHATGSASQAAIGCNVWRGSVVLLQAYEAIGYLTRAQLATT